MNLAMGVKQINPIYFPAWYYRFFHYDFYAQALSKIARGYGQDRLELEAMYRLELIELDRLAHLFEVIEPDLNRYPAIDPQRFRQKVESTLVWLTENGDHDNSQSTSL